MAVAATDTDAIRYAAELPMEDFEDAMQVAADPACGARLIVTRNVRDYERSPSLQFIPGRPSMDYYDALRVNPYEPTHSARAPQMAPHLPRRPSRREHRDETAERVNNMDTMDRYKIKYSIEDAIVILDSAPIRPDLMSETNAVQLTNRAPIAHLAIERGLKALITDCAVIPDETHSLNSLYRDLRKCDKASADYLAAAFNDAVKFFGYNVKVKGFGHFGSLHKYLSKVGTKTDFDALRYWVIEKSSKGNPIPYISPPIHRELLCALLCLFFPSRHETVSDRVEREVTYAMFSGRHISYGADDTEKKLSVQWYKDWLFNTHTSRRSALEEAVDKGYSITDDEFVTETLREAFNELCQSKDPAVRYYIRTLTYLPKGSQRRNPDAIPEVEWHRKDRTYGSVLTPAGTCLGFIEQYPDSAWCIEPLGGSAYATAWSIADAKHYLVNGLTRQVTVTVSGESKQLRIVTGQDSFHPSDPSRTSDIEDSTYEVEFWDANHGLRPGDELSIELQSEAVQRLVSVLKGTVTEVEEQKASVTGTDCDVVKKDR